MLNYCLPIFKIAILNKKKDVVISTNMMNFLYDYFIYFYFLLVINCSFNFTEKF